MYATHYSKKSTPQSEPIPGEVQVKNNAGGYVYELDDWARLDRFLILGSEGNTYYCSEHDMTIDNAKAVERCITADGERAVCRIVEISDSGRAPKNDPALFALALAASAKDQDTRALALAALPKVARIGTHLFHFAAYVDKQRGWGRGLRRAIGHWYTDRKPDSLANQLVKYQSRDGWSHRDLLRLAHPKTDSVLHRASFDWACGRTPEVLPMLISGFERLKAAPTAQNAIEAIKQYGLPREAIPTELLNDVGVWQALLEDMPLTAMVRNLGKMTSIGVFKPLSPECAKVVAALTNKDAIAKARMHPLALLVALRTYAQGHGERGKLSWEPNGQIIDALDKAFYLAFSTVEPTNKAIMLALDVSGSMDLDGVCGSSLTPREACAALALVTANTEPNHMIVGFTSGGPAGWASGTRTHDSLYGGRGGMNGISQLPMITPRMRLDAATKALSNLPFGGTDCSLPMLYALEKGLSVDAFVIYTDNETWAGGIHPSQALREYRAKSGRQAKLIVCGMTSTGFSIADPNDRGMLDVVGMDTATPTLISDFIRG